ncbi:M15 family metallopeptidase [Pseudaeromonas sharmana]|uniref:M15 family metallopeptidase n=1 Tax=Pseudaeromonas sharmana TaxID=328412 RepID=A0ABV8CKJ9_9GAMM
MLSTAQWLGLDDSHLVEVPNNAPHRLTAATAIAFCQLQQAAAADGLRVGIASSYRDFQRQRQIWNGKFDGSRHVHDDAGRTVDMSRLDDEAKVDAILRFSAIPGASRHHWGTDLDLFAPALLPDGQRLQLEPWEYADDGYFSPLTHWLDEHMAVFGFYRPFGDGQSVAAEPWHISHQPEAQAIQQQLSIDALAELLLASQVAGSQLLLARLPQLWQNYVLVNMGK